jgi:hypothetical protein
MKTKNILALLITIITPTYHGLHAADMDHPLYANNRDFLGETKKILAEMGNVYDHEPQDRSAPLEQEHVMNQFWRDVATKNQVIKDHSLRTILHLNFTDAGRYLKRYHIAAAAVAHANLEYTTRGGASALSEAALKNDYALCKLLLESGANPNSGTGNRPVLFSVRSHLLAQLFLFHGADVRQRSWNGENLLHQVITTRNYDIELISLYRSSGLSPFPPARNCRKSTPLHSLALFANDFPLAITQKKVDALFENLTKQDITVLILAHNADGETPLDILNDTQNCLFIERVKGLKNYLNNYLQKACFGDDMSPVEVVEEEQCSICLESLTEENRIKKLNSCNHNQFHQDCITDWLTKSRTCPLCRADL